MFQFHIFLQESPNMYDWQVFIRQYRKHNWVHGPCSFLDLVYFIKSGFVKKSSILYFSQDDMGCRAKDVSELNIVFNFKDNNFTQKFQGLSKAQYDEIQVAYRSAIGLLADNLIAVVDFAFYYTPLWYLRFLNLFGWIRRCPKCQKFSSFYIETIQGWGSQTFENSQPIGGNVYGKNELVVMNTWVDRIWYGCRRCNHKCYKDLWRSVKA